MNLHSLIKYIEQLESDKDLTPHIRKQEFDNMIGRLLYSTKYKIWWWDYPLAQPYRAQIEALKINGVL